MICVMEQNEKWGTSAFSSLKAGLQELGDGYGDEALHLNAALAMFLLAPPEKREEAVALVQQAKRVKSGKSMLEKLQEIKSGSSNLWPTPHHEKIDPPPGRAKK
jgi:hypothetical protein